MTKHASRTQHGDAGDPWAALAIWNSPWTTILSQVGETYAKACADWQQDVAQFVGTRMTENLRLQESLFTCKSIDDVVKVQQDWAATATKEFVEGANRLTQIATRCAQAGMSCAAPEGEARAARRH